MNAFSFTVRQKSLQGVESREAALREAGDLIIPILSGELPQGSSFPELGEMIAGVRKGRTGTSEVTMFKSVGIAAQDAAVAQLAYRNAMELGVGTTIHP